MNKVLKEIFIDRFEQIFDAKKEEISKRKRNYEVRLNVIRAEVSELQQKVLSISPSLKRVLEAIEASMESLSKEELELQEQIGAFEESNFENPELFKDFCFYMLEHLTDLLSKSQNFEEIKTIFGFVFKETPTYLGISNRTAALYPIFAYASQQKNPREGILEVNPNWQGG